MGCIRVLRRNRQLLVVNSTVAAFFVATDWMPVTAMSEADFALNLLSIDGQGEVKPAVQLAPVRTDKPSAPVAITSGGYLSTTTDITQYRETLSAPSSAFIRFGYMARIKAGQSGQSTLQVEMDIAVDDCGAVLGARQLAVQPFMNGTVDADTSYEPITDWASTLKVDKLKLMALVLDNQNTAFEYMFVVRSAVDRMKPGSWIALEAAWTNPAAGNSERNTGELAIPAGANFATRSVYQVGVGLRKKSGSSGNPRCMIHAMTHVKFT